MHPWVHILACPACPFATLVVNTLNEHIAGCHGGQEVSYTLHVCPACDACSTDARLIDEHLLVYHRDDDGEDGEGEEAGEAAVAADVEPLGRLMKVARQAAGRTAAAAGAAAAAAAAAASVTAVEAHACRGCRLVFASLTALRQHRCRVRNCVPPPSSIAAVSAQDDAEAAADPLMSRLLDIWGLWGGSRASATTTAAITTAAAAAAATYTAAAAAAEQSREEEEEDYGEEDDDEPQEEEAEDEAEDATSLTAAPRGRACPATLRCPGCPTRSRTLRDLARHQLRRHGVARCPLCDAVQFSADAAVGHVAEEHPGRPVYPCARCPGMFDRHDRLMEHWDAEHSRSVFKCPYCSRAFLQERYRTRHVRQTHPSRLARAARPCPQCPQAFADDAELRRHLLEAHAADAGGSRLRCGVCARTFAAVKSLRLHELSHRSQPAPFACTLCPYACNTRYLLQCHVRDKHTSFTYDCALCGARLLSRYLLRNHMNRCHGMADAAATVRAAASLKRRGGGR